MSYTNTTVQRTTSPIFGLGTKVVPILAALAIGVGAGFVISNLELGSAESSTTPAISALAHEEFLRINTEDLPRLGTLSGAAPLAVTADVDVFKALNIDTYAALEEWVVARYAVSDHFIDVNVSGFDLPSIQQGSVSRGFWDMNVTSYGFSKAAPAHQPGGPR